MRMRSEREKQSCSMFKGAQLKGVTGLEEASIRSINIGTVEQPDILAGEEARNWLIQQIHTP